MEIDRTRLEAKLQAQVAEGVSADGLKAILALDEGTATIALGEKAAELNHAFHALPPADQLGVADFLTQLALVDRVTRLLPSRVHAELQAMPEQRSGGLKHLPAQLLPAYEQLKRTADEFGLVVGFFVNERAKKGQLAVHMHLQERDSRPTREGAFQGGHEEYAKKNNVHLIVYEGLAFAMGAGGVVDSTPQKGVELALEVPTGGGGEHGWHGDIGWKSFRV